MVDWLSLSVPFAYLGVLLGSLTTFSSLYRKRKAAKSSSLEPWFPPNQQRDIYLSLLHTDPSPATGNKPIPDSVLKAALLQRACEDISRLISIRNAEQALQQLLQRGSVGDELWQRFSRGKEEVEASCRDVVQEANAFQPGWGQRIFQSANEMVHNATIREKINAIQAQVETDKEWWEKRRASIQAEFMSELDQEKKGPPLSTSSTSTPNVAGKQSSAAAAATGSGEKSSDGEDGVLVEREVGKGGGGGGGGGGKKKKGKK